jgi:hypothetical protein
LKELTSAYDDVEKRMAIFLGLGALIFCSLYLYIQGADLDSYLIRGVLALTVFTVAGWGYGHWLRKLIRKQETEEELPENVERQHRDAKALEGKVVNTSSMGESVIPLEQTAGHVVDFTLPELEPFVPLAAPASPAAPSAAKAARAEAVDEGDLPPPPVPSGI